jgi:phospholipid/cholesterol/gamma-HCH transport system substrate-binding protein
MESKINYTLVGGFVVLLLAGLIGFAYWLGKYGGQQEYSYYHVYMSESVAGLSNDSSVKYRGVMLEQWSILG